jgi:hypothetical protein
MIKGRDITTTNRRTFRSLCLPAQQPRRSRQGRKRDTAEGAQGRVRAPCPSLRFEAQWRKGLTLYLFQVRLERPAEMTRTDFYGIWEKESKVAAELFRTGECRGAYKVAGTDEIVAIFDLASPDRIDTPEQDLHIYRMNFQHLAKDIRWTALREYDDWYQHLRGLSRSTSDTP